MKNILKGEDEIYAIIGFDTTANPIEVFYNYIDDEVIKIFHAMALRDKVAAQMNT
ncbi:MAG: hypothetical protein FWG77_10825 [Treponema sp.]|nr:hypothetical protein [Treponema sp.]